MGIVYSYIFLNVFGLRMVFNDEYYLKLSIVINRTKLISFLFHIS